MRVHDSSDLVLQKDVVREASQIKFAGKILLDIGAHVGFFSAEALRNGAKQVICVEPTKPSFRLLKDNVKDSRSVVLNVAIAATAGHATMVFKPSSMARASIDKNISHMGDEKAQYKTEKVETVTIASLVTKYKPNIIKIDVEGAEYAALDALEDLPKCVEIVMPEWHNVGGRKGYLGFLRCTKKLRSWGFRPDRSPNVEVRRHPKTNAITGTNLWVIRTIPWRRKAK